MRLDSPTHCPDCHAPITVHALSFYAPRTCPDCGWGVFEAQVEGKRDLLGSLALAAGSASMVVLGIVGVLFGSLQAEILGLVGIAGLILAVDRCLLAWEFLRLHGLQQAEEVLPSWCPPELAQASPRQVARRDGFERPTHALYRMGVGVAALVGMALLLPVQPWERGALIGYISVGVMLLAVRPLRITLEDWRHQRLAAHGRFALGNVMKVEQTWYGGRRLRYRYLDADGRPHEGKIWHPAPPLDLPEGSAITVLYRRGEPSVSVPYPAARYLVSGRQRGRRAELAS